MACCVPYCNHHVDWGVNGDWWRGQFSGLGGFFFGLVLALQLLGLVGNAGILQSTRQDRKNCAKLTETDGGQWWGQFVRQWKLQFLSIPISAFANRSFRKGKQWLSMIENITIHMFDPFLINTGFLFCHCFFNCQCQNCYECCMNYVSRFCKHR